VSGHRSGAAVVVVLCAVALVGLSACNDDTQPPSAVARLDDETVTVGSFDFPESVVLAELYSQALERAGMTVHRSFQLGPRELVAPALAQGLVELVPEYRGTAHEFFAAGSTSSELDPLRSAPAEDANAFVVTRKTARRYHLRSLSDLRPVASRLTFGGPPECPSRPLCLPGLRSDYGLRFEEFLRLDAGGPVSRQALLDGAVDVALLFSSVPALASGCDLVELTDDRDLQPHENVTPFVHRGLLGHFPRLEEAADEVSAHLTTGGLRRLNARMAAGDRSVHAIAADWLDAEGIG
jgi:osmoprotectant transport system substrate-binding protein